MDQAARLAEVNERIAQAAEEVVGWLCPGPDTHCHPADYADETAVWTQVPDGAFGPLQRLWKLVGERLVLLDPDEGGEGDQP